MVKKKSIVKNTIMNMFLTASSFIFPLITFPYVSRVLGAAGNGKIAFASSVISYFTMFASLGIPTYGIRACAKCRDDKDKLSKCTHELLFINLITTTLTYFIFIIMLFAVPKFKNDKTLFLIMSSSIILNALGMEWLYKAIEEYSYITIRSVLAKLLSVVLMFLFVKSPGDYLFYGFLTIVSSVGSYVLNIVGAGRFINIELYSGYNLRQHFKPILVLFAGAVATTIYGHMDAVMLGFIHGDFQSGLYSASVKIKSVLISVTSSLTTVLIPRMSYCIEQKNYREINMFIEKGMRFTSLLAFPIVVFCALNAEDCMVFIAGAEYAEAKYAFLFQSICVLVVSFSSVFSNQILIPFGADTDNFRAMCAGTIVNLVLNSFWIKPFGASGAAAATLITEVVVCFVLMRSAKKLLGGTLSISFIAKYGVVAFLAALVMLLITRMTTINTLFFKLLLSGISYFVTYIAIMYFIKEPMLRRIIQDIKIKIKSHQS